ncbi:MAG: hypothetical protein M3314_02220 [Actinomycetota bacterium]|nr:hypothetical protein [Actinomycetota bacterium]
MSSPTTTSRPGHHRPRTMLASGGGDPTNRRAGRRKAFRTIATVMAVSGVLFGVFTAVFGIVSEAQKIHAFHNAVVAALLLVLAAPPAIAAARAPERAGAPLVHLVALSAAGLGTMLLGQKIDVFTLPFIVFVGVLVALRVASFDALRSGHWSVPLAILVVTAAVPLMTYAVGEAELQRVDTSSEHAEFNHWVEMSFVAVAVLMLGALTALRPAAFRLSAWSVGVTLAVLGAASITFSGYASAMSESWAWAALAGGVAFVVLAEFARRRFQRQEASRQPGGSR